MHRRTGTAIIAVVLAAAAPLVVGAAVAGAIPSARQLVLDAIAASKTVSSVDVVGSVSSGGQTIGLDVQATNADEGKGMISIDGGNVKVVRLGKLVYFNANAAFWTQSAGAASAAFAGRWVSVPAGGSDGKDFAQFVGTAALFSQILTGSRIDQSTFTLDPNTTVGGIPVYAIAGTNTSSGSKGTVYIARKGKPYILELDTTSSAGTGELTFSDYNRPVHASVPPHAVTLQKLEATAAQAG
jgi:hypothetical protein